jgi:pimeloyl-ACP methyl ester carboxylesterase
MLQFFIGWTRLRWTRSSPMFHPLPEGVGRDFVATPLGGLELLVSEPVHQGEKQPPILFVHGGFGHAAVWLEWMTYLSKQYAARTYAVSVRNHGASYSCSSWFRMVYRTNLDDVACDLTAAIHEVETREGVAPILVSHSAGGGLCQYILCNGMARTPALVLAGAVPHYGFIAPMWNWLTRIDWWMFLRGLLMFQHPRAALCTTLLVKNAFFGPDYPVSRAKDFEQWMAPYESLRWPSQTVGSWQNGKNVWLDTAKIVRNITTTDPSKDRVLIILGSEDKMMQGTQARSVAEYAGAIGTSRDGNQVSGVRLVEIPRAGHHLQNDIQWEDGARALLTFLRQL